MDIQDAADICHPLGTAHVRDRRLQDVMRDHAAPIEAACAKGYGLALHEFEADATVLRSFLRGMVDAEIVRDHIEKCRERLTQMEGALAE